MPNIEQTLEERGKSYGDYAKLARFVQGMKNDINRETTENWPGHRLPVTDLSVMLESLDMIAAKLGRIVVGDPLNVDSWRDIAGYATLVVNYIETKENPK